MLDAGLPSYHRVISLHHTNTVVERVTIKGGRLDSGSYNAQTDEPQFVDRWRGNYRLKQTSPCVDAGENRVGNPRPSTWTGTRAWCAASWIWGAMRRRPWAAFSSCADRNLHAGSGHPFAYSAMTGKCSSMRCSYAKKMTFFCPRLR